MALNCGPGAVELMLDEVGKYPEFYKLGLHNIDSPDDLTGDAKEAWEAVMEAMSTDYPDAPEKAVWKAWRWIRRYYSTSKCPQKYAGRINYLTQMKIDKIEESAYQKEAWKTSAIVFNKVSSAELRKSIPSLAHKDDPDGLGKFSSTRVGLRPKDPDAIAKCGIRKNLTFDNTYSPKPKAHRPKKAAGIQGRGRMSVIDSFAVEYTEQACDLLFEEIGRYPEIYTPSCNIPDPRNLHEGARKAWLRIMKNMHEVYPSMNSLEAWKAWRTLRRNYNNSSCPKNWVGKLPFLNTLLASKDQLYQHRKQKMDEENGWTETEEAGKFAAILDRLQPKTDKYEDDEDYDENAMLDDPSLMGSSVNSSIDGYEGEDQTSNEDEVSTTSMQLLLSSVQRASEQDSPAAPKRKLIQIPIVRASKQPRILLTSPPRSVASSSSHAEPATPATPATLKFDDSFKKLLKEKWTEIADLAEPKANLSLFKKRIVTVLNRAYTEM